MNDHVDALAEQGRYSEDCVQWQGPHKLDPLYLRARGLTPSRSAQLLVREASGPRRLWNNPPSLLLSLTWQSGCEYRL